MFRGDESNRRRKDAGKHRKKCAWQLRRLGFEMMESRSLLSATPLSTGPLDLRLFQLNWSAASVDGGTVTISSSADNDGGYISDTTALNYGGTFSSAPITNVISSVSDMDNLVSRGATIVYSNSTSGSLDLNFTGNATGGGMLPLVIASSEGGVSMRANIEPVRRESCPDRRSESRRRDFNSSPAAPGRPRRRLSIDPAVVEQLRQQPDRCPLDSDDLGNHAAAGNRVAVR